MISIHSSKVRPGADQPRLDRPRRDVGVPADTVAVLLLELCRVGPAARPVQVAAGGMAWYRWDTPGPGAAGLAIPADYVLVAPVASRASKPRAWVELAALLRGLGGVAGGWCSERAAELHVATPLDRSALGGLQGGCW